jgi:hypothetical protein
MIVINTHSCIDVITNSSSELFICSTDKSLEVIKDIIITFVIAYDKAYEYGKTFEDMFEEPYILEELDEDFIETLGSYGKFDYLKFPKFNEFYHKEGGYDKCHKEWQDAIKVWMELNKETLEKDYKGKVIIRSASDNSIPYGLMEVICDIFNADRTHLG